MYSTKVQGETLQFGTSGLLYRSNKLMYDKGTNTLWNQFVGEPAAGPLVGSGIKLELLPVTVTSWADWVAAHPDTTVVDADTGYYPADNYESEGSPFSIYYNYRTRPGTMFPVWRQNDALDPKGQLFGLRLNGQTRAYPLDTLQDQTLINDSLGGANIVVVTLPEGGSRAYRRNQHRFAPDETMYGEDRIAILVDEDQRLWRMEEDALVRIEDHQERLPRLPSHNAYWFGWFSFYPDTEIYAPAKPVGVMAGQTGQPSLPAEPAPLCPGRDQVRRGRNSDSSRRRPAALADGRSCPGSHRRPSGTVAPSAQP